MESDSSGSDSLPTPPPRRAETKVYFDNTVVEEKSSICEEEVYQPKNTFDDTIYDVAEAQHYQGEQQFSFESSSSDEDEVIPPPRANTASATDGHIKNEIKRRHQLPGSERPKSANVSFSNSSDMRAYLFNEWKKSKCKSAAQQRKLNVEEQKKREAAVEQEKLEKLAESKAAYDAWLSKSKDRLREKAIQRKKDKTAKDEKEKELAEKRHEASLAFKQWEARKTERLKEERRNKFRKELKSKNEQLQVKKEKEKKCESAYKQWKSTKDERLKDEHKKASDAIQASKMHQRTKEIEKEQEALKRYQDWLKKKEKQLTEERRRDVFAQSNPGLFKQPAWSPPSAQNNPQPTRFR